MAENWMKLRKSAESSSKLPKTAKNGSKKRGYAIFFFLYIFAVFVIFKGMTESGRTESGRKGQMCKSGIW
jgi:hypothetical protein